MLNGPILLVASYHGTTVEPMEFMGVTCSVSDVCRSRLHPLLLDFIPSNRLILRAEDIIFIVYTPLKKIICMKNVNNLGTAD